MSLLSNIYIKNSNIHKAVNGFYIHSGNHFRDSVVIRSGVLRLKNIRPFVLSDRLCGLVVRVLGYRSGDPVSIPGTTRKKNGSGSGTGSTQPREYK
jgi:hypothetical protein